MSIPKPCLAALFAFPVSEAGTCSFLFVAGVPYFLHIAWPYPNELVHYRCTDAIDSGAALEFAAVVGVHFDYSNLVFVCLVAVVLSGSIDVVCALDSDLNLILAVVAAIALTDVDVAIALADLASSAVVANVSHNFSAHY